MWIKFVIEQTKEETIRIKSLLGCLIIVLNSLHVIRNGSNAKIQAFNSQKDDIYIMRIQINRINLVTYESLVRFLRVLEKKCLQATNLGQ